MSYLHGGQDLMRVKNLLRLSLLLQQVRREPAELQAEWKALNGIYTDESRVKTD
jgi:hypothetical protein